MAAPAPIILELGPDFYDAVRPASFPEAHPHFLNWEKAQSLNLTELKAVSDWQLHFHQFKPFAGNLSEPLALRYHGHQFHHYNHELGDGRGFLFAQFQGDDGKIYDLGTKGSGITPYSRSGDGRLTLKGAVREALATELLESLGVNTSKTFCFFETGEALERNDEPSPTRAAVLTRLSQSHIRIGTFQRLAFLQEKENLQKLLAYCLRHYFPEIETGDPAFSFLKEVSKRLAQLSAQYMISGFVHGVLNSDNMNITGESFDYGPYRFLPIYDPNFTAAYFDHSGLYCFGRQPSAIYWNVGQLAASLKWAYPDLNAEEALGDFGLFFAQEISRLFFRRLNLKPRTEEKNDELLNHFFLFLATSQIGYEQAFFDLYGGIRQDRLANSPAKLCYQIQEFKNLEALLKDFEIADREKIQRPYFQQNSPCTLLIDEIEALWSPIESKNDWSSFHKKVDQIRSFRGIYKLF